ncbi:hypothetical protein SCD_n00485 [Sulfuricella denitrificans skB26]|uniref:Uncharacterized protein n=1 Tax=Sulfuricella denitrificans (strain DSM 22764 / NBRC 105220 / skB26) TaxID=1163617 RepID=S6AB54_SULDS|nr:hypothetical protein SCD_n00485 [Sulfuricella denitrificans skB26]
MLPLAISHDKLKIQFTEAEHSVSSLSHFDPSVPDRICATPTGPGAMHSAGNTD